MSGAAMTTNEILARLTRLEQEVAAGKQAAVTMERDGWGDDGAIGRRRLLKLAGLAAAASAGAALVTSTSASAADGGNVILGGSGDTSNANFAEHPTEVHLDGTVNPKVVLLANDTTSAPNQSAYSATLAGWGVSRSGVYGLSVQGTGIIANGGFNGVLALCSGTTGAGVNAIGGSNGPGVLAQGQGTGQGVLATGGPSSGGGVRGIGGFPNGTGVEGYGLGTGAGVVATGGPTSGTGVAATGGGAGVGVIAVAGGGSAAGVANGQGVNATGSSSSPGVYATGGPTNGPGVQASGLGTGAGVVATGGPTSGTGVTATGGGAGVGVIAVAGGGSAANVFGGTGVNATGSLGGPGVYATGGPTSGYGVSATGGAPNGTGVIAGGQGGGLGVVGFGGSSNGTGVQASGGGAGVGLIAIAGGGSPAGVGLGQGVNATGSLSGPGVYATGGPPNGVGVQGVGQGTGFGVYGTSSTSVGGVFSGGRAQIGLLPMPAVGPPTSGPHSNGDVWVDSLGAVWICTVTGTPGTFAPLQQGGLGNALFSAVSTQQYTLPNSDGVTWVDLDATALKLTITPTFKCLAVLSGNCDLWTANATYNQDVGIAISGGAYPTTLGQPEAWKESGGFAGTFSPNAAFVQAVKPLAAGTTYTVKLQWKTNKPASGATIYAGAGPIPASSTTFSPTLLTALLIATA